MDMGAFALFSLLNIEKSGYFGNIVHMSFLSTFVHMKPRQGRLNNQNLSERGQTLCVFIFLLTS